MSKVKNSLHTSRRPDSLFGLLSKSPRADKIIQLQEIASDSKYFRQEIHGCLTTLQKSHAGKGFMHEAFHKDDPNKFTRSWFAWANTLFGELVLKTFNERPDLLN